MGGSVRPPGRPFFFSDLAWGGLTIHSVSFLFFCWRGCPPFAVVVPPPARPVSVAAVPHASGLLAHPSVSTTLRRWDALAKGRPKDNRKDRRHGALYKYKIGPGGRRDNPRKTRLAPRPRATDRPLDGVPSEGESACHEGADT